MFAATDDKSRSLAGHVVGTPGYMAPEQLAAQPSDARADVFSFCVVAWEAYFGARPFVGQNSSELLSAIAAGPPRRRAFPLSIAAGVERVLRSGLAVERLSRPSTIQAVLTALRAAHQRPRNIRVAIVSVCLMAVLAGALHQLQLAPPSRCDHGVAAWGDTWNAAQQHRLANAFAATGHPRAADVSARVGAIFDQQANAWRDAEQQVCVAREHGQSSTVLADQQSLCLARQRHETVALFELLLGANLKEVDDAITAALRLPGTEVCLRSPNLLTMTPPPRDHTSRLAIERIEKSLGAAAAAHSAQRWSTCVAASQSSIEAAQKLDYAPLLAQAKLQLARCIEYTGTLPQAEASLHDAATAAQRGGDQRTLAFAWTRLLFLVGYERRQFAESEQWARYARAVLDRLGNDDELEYGWALNLGLVHSRSGAHDGEVLIARAQKSAQQKFGVESLEAQSAASALANLYLDAGDAERALPIHRAQLAAERTRLGPLHRGSVTTLINLTLDLLMLEKPGEAMAMAEAVMTVSNAQPGNWDDHWARQTYASALRANGRITAALDEDRAAAATCRKLLGEHWDCAFALAGEGLDLLALHRPREAIAPLDAACQLRAHDEAPDPEMTMGLSHAIWEGGGDRQHARELARGAQKVQQRTVEKLPSSANRKILADIDKWLAQIGAGV